MAQDGTAPRWLGWTNSRGVPVYAVIFTNAFGAICLLNLSDGAAKAYGYIISLSGVSTFIVWGAISFIHIRFAWPGTHRVHWQGSSIPSQCSTLTTCGLASSATSSLPLVQAWGSLLPWSAADFVVGYILLPLFFILFFGYKYIFKTKWLRIDEIDLLSGRRADMDTNGSDELNGVVSIDGQAVQDEAEKPSPWYKKFTKNM